MAGDLTFDSSVTVPVPASGQSAQVEVRDNTDIPDRLEFNSYGTNTFTIDGLMLGRWDIILTESTATLFSTDALAESIGRDVTDFDTRSFQLNLSVDPDPRNGQAIINGSVTAFSATVPLPSALWLFGSGLLGLIGISRGKKLA
jgi:hypothetical protein